MEEKKENLPEKNEEDKNEKKVEPSDKKTEEKETLPKKEEVKSYDAPKEEVKKAEVKEETKAKTAEEKETEKKNLDTSEKETDKLGIPKPKEEIEEGDGKVTSNFTPDEKLEKWTKGFLQDQLKDAVHEIKKDFLIIFGLFASFVTFISINVQVFKNNDNTLELVGICAISLSFIVFFALIINGIVKDKAEWIDFKKPTYLINIIFLTIGVIFLSIGNSKNGQIIKRFENKISADSIQINSMQTNINNLKNKITETDSAIINLQNKIKKLEAPKPKESNTPKKKSG